MSSIQEILNASTKSSKLEPLIKMLNYQYSKSAHVEFTKEYLRCLRFAIAFTVQNNVVNKVLQITIKFAIQLNEDHLKNVGDDGLMHPFLQDLLVFLIKTSKSPCYHTRAHAINLLGKILQQLSELNCDEKLLKMLYKMASDRLRDASSNVRAEAALAVSYLQDPTNSDCPIYKDLLKLMTRDPYNITRRNIVEVIVMNRQTINLVKERLQDLYPCVKKAALTRISEKISANCFSFKSRLEILEICYNDPVLRDTLKNKLLPSWLKQADEDIVKFLHFVDIQSSPKVMQECLFMLFEQDDLRNLASKLNLDPELHVIPKERLNNETMFFWLSLCQYVKKQKSEFALDLFDELTPTLNVFCDYFEAFIQDTKKKYEEDDAFECFFVFEQLLVLAEEVDFDDTYGSKKMRSLVMDALNSSFCLIEMIEPLIKYLRTVFITEDEFLSEVAKLSLELSNDYINLEKNEISLRRLVRGLKVAVHALKITSLKNCAPQFLELKETVLKICTSHSNSNVRLAAVEALGLYLMHDVDEAHNSYMLLMRAVHCDDLKVRAAALKSVFDILMWFGGKFLAGPSQEGQQRDAPSTAEEELFSAFCEGLLPFLDSEVRELRTIAVQGMGRLLLLARVNCASVFSKLLLMCYNPSCQKDVEILQFLTSFLPAYATSSGFKKEYVEDAFILVLESIMEAPDTSSISEINPFDAGMALLQLSRLVSSAASKTGNRIHDHLAPRLLNMISKDTKSPWVPALVRLLNHLELTGRRKEELIAAVKTIISEVKNKTVIKNLKKFYEKLTVLESLNTSSFCVLDEVVESSDNRQEDPQSPSLERNYQENDDANAVSSNVDAVSSSVDVDAVFSSVDAVSSSIDADAVSSSVDADAVFSSVGADAVFSSVGADAVFSSVGADAVFSSVDAGVISSSADAVCSSLDADAVCSSLDEEIKNSDSPRKAEEIVSLKSSLSAFSEEQCLQQASENRVLDGDSNPISSGEIVIPETPELVGSGNSVD